MQPDLHHHSGLNNERALLLHQTFALTLLALTLLALTMRRSHSASLTLRALTLLALTLRALTLLRSRSTFDLDCTSSFPYCTDAPGTVSVELRGPTTGYWICMAARAGLECIPRAARKLTLSHCCHRGTPAAAEALVAPVWQQLRIYNQIVQPN